ncbi:MAG TPA: DUF167 domain-containing protein [Candidatus Absconditabacterales bacterium]|nr:DUF167 domain-containing protein [Candidatus Absconditabacterales bacterium]HMT26892.1 DUF167 domain-containing protein [Candidatus Absconditabacterales bacterium]
MKIVNIEIITGAKTESQYYEKDIFGAEFLKLKLRAKPINGEANKALLEKIATLFSARKSDIKILQGHQSRKKVLQIPISDSDFSAIVSQR